MMNQETCVDIEGLREQGWTLEEISAETGWHPATISKRLKQGSPPRRQHRSSAQPACQDQPQT